MTTEAGAQECYYDDSENNTPIERVKNVRREISLIIDIDLLLKEGASFIYQKLPDLKQHYSENELTI